MAGQTNKLSTDTRAKPPFDLIDVAFGVLAASTAPVSPIFCIIAVVQYFVRHSAAVCQ